MVRKLIFGGIIYSVPIDMDEVSLDIKLQVSLIFRVFAVGANDGRTIPKVESRKHSQAEQGSHFSVNNCVLLCYHKLENNTLRIVGYLDASFGNYMHLSSQLIDTCFWAIVLEL